MHLPADALTKSDEGTSGERPAELPFVDVARLLASRGVPVPQILADAFAEFARKTGRRYGAVEAYRCEDAEYVLVGMGCYMETVKATVDYLRSRGIAAGCLTVFVFRPFPARQIVEAHSGRIEVAERPGGGARFRIELPAATRGGATRSGAGKVAA